MALDVTGTAGYRLIPAIELGVEAALGHQSASSPDFSSAHTGFGDTTFRVRWDAIDEPMPYEKVPWPALTIAVAVRTPTASLGRDESGVFSGTTGSVGSQASSEGLGAWEPSLSAALVRDVGPHFEVTLAGQAAYRFSDTSLGIERHLSPRFFGELSARYAPTPDIGIGLMTDLGAEGDVSLNGERRPATSQRLWTVGVNASGRVEGTGLRCGGSVRVAPVVDGLDRNATRATSVSISLGYVVQ